jgi:hypothetical protein
MIKYIKLSAVATAIIVSTTGCVSQNVQSNTIDPRDQQIAQLKKDLQAKEAKISQLSQMNEDIQSKAKADASKYDTDSLVPPNAKPGECYAKVLVPATYENKTEQKLAHDAKTMIKVIPATYKVVEKKVTIREASTKLIPVPATYKTVTETIMVEPEKTNLIPVPATYKTVTETIMV